MKFKAFQDFQGLIRILIIHIAKHYASSSKDMSHYTPTVTRETPKSRNRGVRLWAMLFDS